MARLQGNESEDLYVSGEWLFRKGYLLLVNSY